jgi:hypothetical protein
MSKEVAFSVVHELVKANPESPTATVKAGPEIEAIFARAKAHRILKSNVRMVSKLLLIYAQANHCAGGDGHAWLREQLGASASHYADDPAKHNLQQLLACQLAVASMPIFTVAQRCA